ncbi:MAG: HAD-IC family P-type ATPase, partial [Candidatus Aenigmarchaeota archaeon]|nr:HAD-IC family P-type ATPase [Candidatus Aenigmarchaeota archaeon]
GYNGEGKIIPFSENENLSDIDEINEVNEIIKNSIICNEANLIKKPNEWTSHGDAVDIALLALGYKHGFKPDEINKNIKTLREIPFECDRKFSARFYKEDSEVHVAVKGAFEIILQFCSEMKTSKYTVKINGKRIENQIENLSATGHRIIAVAEGKIPEKADTLYDEKDLKNLTFLGLIGLIDPLRPEARSAVDTCKKAGIKVIMITGDHPETAFTIGKELGIAESRKDVVKGSKFSEIHEKSEEFAAMVNNATIFARVTPLQKLYIVEALAKSDNFIAVTGDGVNDAPALKKAHIGVAMGSGTDVAKDVASIIVVDDNFASVVAGVEEGRYAYDNIRKVVYLLIA